MSTQAFCPAGTTLQFDSSGVGTTYDKTVGEVISLKKSGSKMGTDDATNLNSPSNYKEFIATTKDGGTWAVEYNFVPGDAGQVALQAAYEAGTLLSFKITLPNSLGAFTFNAIVEEHGNYTFAVDKKATDSLQLKISGPVTFA